AAFSRPPSELGQQRGQIFTIDLIGRADEVGLPAVDGARLRRVESIRQIDQIFAVDAAVEVGVAGPANTCNRRSARVDLPETSPVGGNREPLADAWGRRWSETDVAHLDQRKGSRSEAGPGSAGVRGAVEAEHRPHVEDFEIVR